MSESGDAQARHSLAGSGRRECCGPECCDAECCGQGNAERETSGENPKSEIRR